MRRKQPKYGERTKVTFVTLSGKALSVGRKVHLENLAEFMFLTGMRIGEATILRPENFNFEQSFVEVTGTLDKTQGYRNAKKDLPRPLKVPDG